MQVIHDWKFETCYGWFLYKTKKNLCIAYNQSYYIYITCNAIFTGKNCVFEVKLKKKTIKLQIHVWLIVALKLNIDQKIKISTGLVMWNNDLMKTPSITGSPTSIIVNYTNRPLKILAIKILMIYLAHFCSVKLDNKNVHETEHWNFGLKSLWGYRQWIKEVSSRQINKYDFATNYI